MTTRLPPHAFCVISEKVWNTFTKPRFVFEVLNCQRPSASHRVVSDRKNSNYRCCYFQSHHCTRSQSNSNGQHNSWDYLHRKEISKTSCPYLCAATCFTTSSQTTMTMFLDSGLGDRWLEQKESHEYRKEYLIFANQLYDLYKVNGFPGTPESGGVTSPPDLSGGQQGGGDFS